LIWLREVVQRTAAHDEVERRVHERQVVGVALLQQNIGDPRTAEAIGADGEQRRREVESDDLANMGRDLLGRMGGAAGDVEDDHVAVERFQPRQR
jgi:hypothetical protein